MKLQSPITTTGDGTGVSWPQSMVVAGVLVGSLAVTHFMVGSPAGPREWLLLAATAIVAPAVGYLVAVRRFDMSFAVAVTVLAVTFVVAAVGG